MRWVLLILALWGLWWVVTHWQRVSRRARRVLTAAGIPIAA